MMLGYSDALELWVLERNPETLLEFLCEPKIELPWILLLELGPQLHLPLPLLSRHLKVLDNLAQS